MHAFDSLRQQPAQLPECLFVCILGLPQIWGSNLTVLMTRTSMHEAESVGSAQHLEYQWGMHQASVLLPVLPII